MSQTRAQRRVELRLKLNIPAFEITTKAIRALSNQNRKYETLSSVVAQICQSHDVIPVEALQAVNALGDIAGDVTVYLRLTDADKEAFERFRSHLHDTFEPTFRVPEAVVLCCLMVPPYD